MYVHVPSAWIGLASFSSIAILSIAHFIFKIKNIKLITKSIAPIGLMFTCLALVTGSIWGQPTWGTWWAWDARITSMLILALFYIGFISTHKFISDENKANKISSIIAIIGLINIPIIKYSVDWWNTLHQPASIKVNWRELNPFFYVNAIIVNVFCLNIVLCANFSNEIQDRNH